MGISFGHIYPDFPDCRPLRYISEHCMMLPVGGELRVSNSGWPKILYFFSGTLEMVLPAGETYSIAPRETVILYGPQQQRYRALKAAPATWAHVLLISFGQPAPDGDRPVNWDAPFGRYIAETFPANSHLDTKHSSALWDLAVRLRNTCSSSGLLQKEQGNELARLFTFRIAEFAGLHTGISLPKRDQLAEQAADMALEDFSTTRSAVAKRLGISVATLDRACRERFGTPYAAYLDNVKIEQAKSLLLSSSLPVARIGVEAGFQSASSFSRAFKTQTGQTPMEFQQSFQSRKTAWREANIHNAARRPPSRRNIAEPRNEVRLTTPATLRTRYPSLLATLEGSCRVTIGEKTFTLCTNTVLLVAEDELVILNYFNKTAFVFYLEGKSGWHDPSTQGSPLIRALAVSLKRARAWPQEGHLLTPLRAFPGNEEALTPHLRLQRRSLLASLWWAAWERALSQSSASAKEHPLPTPSDEPNHRLLVSHAKEFIRKHSEFTLGEVAWAVGVSEEHLSRVFRQETGETVMQYRLSRRLRQAQRELVQTESPIPAVAEKAGFISVTHFYKAFKTRFGCTPAAFRKRGVLP